MNALVSENTRARGKTRSLLAPLFIGWAAIQFWIADLILSAHPIQRGFTVVGAVGLVLLFSSVLVAMVGVGEAGNTMVQAFRKD